MNHRGELAPRRSCSSMHSFHSAWRWKDVANGSKREATLFRGWKKRTTLPWGALGATPSLAWGWGMTVVLFTRASARLTRGAPIVNVSGILITFVESNVRALRWLLADVTFSEMRKASSATSSFLFDSRNLSLRSSPIASPGHRRAAGDLIRLILSTALRLYGVGARWEERSATMDGNGFCESV